MEYIYISLGKTKGLPGNSNIVQHRYTTGYGDGRVVCNILMGLTGLVYLVHLGTSLVMAVAGILPCQLRARLAVPVVQQASQLSAIRSFTWQRPPY